RCARSALPPPRSRSPSAGSLTRRADDAHVAVVEREYATGVVERERRVGRAEGAIEEQPGAQRAGGRDRGDVAGPAVRVEDAAATHRRRVDAPLEAVRVVVRALQTAIGGMDATLRLRAAELPHRL